MRFGLHFWLPALPLCGACVSTNPYYVDPTSESDTTPMSVGASTTTGVDPTAGDVTSTTAGTTTDGETETDETETEAETEAVDTEMPAAYCGDGEKNPDEECDDGNMVDDDGCTNLCALPECGDGILNQDSETCDDGDLNSDSASCTLECKPNACGDGKLGPDENCDDGNEDGGDGCSPECALEECGNGKVDAGEYCDDGDDDEDDLCTSLCVPPPEVDALEDGGLSAILGKDGAEVGVPCDGILTGLEGTFGGGLVTQIGTTCTDVKLELVAMGSFRLVPTGPVVYSDGLVGIAPDAPETFSKKCPTESPFMMGAGGWGQMGGLTEIGLQCVNLLVKPGEDTYTITAEKPQLVPVGKAEGMILMPVTCADIPGSFATELIALKGDPAIAGLRFRCKIPIFNEW